MFLTRFLIRGIDNTHVKQFGKVLWDAFEHLRVIFLILNSIHGSAIFSSQIELFEPTNEKFHNLHARFSTCQSWKSNRTFLTIIIVRGIENTHAKQFSNFFWDVFEHLWVIFLTLNSLHGSAIF